MGMSVWVRWHEVRRIMVDKKHGERRRHFQRVSNPRRRETIVFMEDDSCGIRNQVLLTIANFLLRRISPSLFIGIIRQQKLAMTLPNIILPPVNFTPKVIDNFKDFFINFIIWPYECRGLSSLFSSSPICL